jgi:imidazolonepropionase
VADLIVRNVGRLTTWHGPVVEAAAVVIRDGAVAWTGPDAALPADLAAGPELDAAGAAVLPGFVDCHTHAIWAGDRRTDFEGRLSGGGYSPGGIMSTVMATRSAATAELVAAFEQRLARMRSGGTSTVEVKTGYGLSADDELRLLDVIAAADVGGMRCEPTYLGAHVVPPDRDRDGYVDEVVATAPAAAARGARWCDVFCDEGAFTVEEARRILTAGRTAGLGLRIHAEQLAHTGAAGLAAELGCASADHLDHVTADDARALAVAGVVTVVVPVVSLYTRSMQWSQGGTLLDAGCTIAVATDCNPGSAWTESMPYAMQLAALGMGLPVEVVLRAATLGGAAALRRDDIGHLGVGACGDLVVLDADHETDLLAHLGANPVRRTVIAGVPT